MVNAEEGCVEREARHDTVLLPLTLVVLATVACGGRAGLGGTDEGPLRGALSPMSTGREITAVRP
jgi:hypothetical protein